jgi:hypothetical protein
MPRTKTEAQAGWTPESVSGVHPAAWSWSESYIALRLAGGTIPFILRYTTNCP